MLQPIQLEDDAAWKYRYRAAITGSTAGTAAWQPSNKSTNRN